MRGRKDNAEGQPEAETAYFRAVLGKVYHSLAETLANKQQTLPNLKIYPPDHPEESQAMSVDQQGLHVGLGLFLSLDTALLAYTSFLLDNYIFQIGPIMGDTPRLSQVTSLEAFPLEALTLHAASLFPEATAKDGYRKSPFQGIMEFIQALRHTKAPLDELPAVLSRQVVKPAQMDFRMFLDRFDSDLVFNTYLDEEMGPFCLRLHYQMLLDATYFLLAHEIAHFLLGHHLVDPENPTQSQADEAQADKRALGILGAVSSFQLRSLLTLFGYWHFGEEELQPHQLDHPYSRDRILILATTVLSDPQGAALRADVNAGMMLLTTPLEPIMEDFKWDGFQEECLLSIFHYSDMDYNAHLLFYLERPPHAVGIEDGGRENVFLLSLMTFEIQIVLRDRIHPEKTYYHGQVLFRPGFVGEDLLFGYKADKVMTRLHLRIPAPPEWWLDHPNAEVAVESVEHAAEPMPEPKDVMRHSMYIYLDPVGMDYTLHLQSIPSPVADVMTRSTVLLAARRFRSLGMTQFAVQFDEWLYQFDEGLLPYQELIDLALDLMRQQQFSKAAQIARRALSPVRPMRPGFHFVIATDYAIRNQFPEAFEHAFLEIYGIGEFGEYFESASQLLAKVAADPTDPMMRCLRLFRLNFDAGIAKASKRTKKAAALKLLQSSQEALVRASKEARSDLVCLLELKAEVLFEICKLEGGGFAPACQAFEAVLQLEPRFVPARVQLAHIALLEDDLPRAHAIWQEAYTIMPFNHFVFEFRELVEKTNPDTRLTSSPASDMFKQPN